MGMRMRWWTAAAATLALVLLSSCSKDAPTVDAAEASAALVSVVDVKQEPFAVTSPVTGTLISTSRVDVKAEVIGRIVRFDKQEGDRVEAGETVVWLDEEGPRLAGAQAESALEVATAALEKARVIELHSARELERAQNLLQSGGITDKDLQGARVAAQDARAQVALAGAQIEQARAALEVTRKRLRDCRIRAPVAGEIQKKFINPGAYVEAPTPVFSLVDNSRLELEAPVASADLAPVRAGQKVTFTVNSYPGETFRGHVIEINPAVDTETRAAKVRVQVAPSGGRLKAGMFAQGEILTGIEAQAIVVPASAVYREELSARESFVFVVENDRAVRRVVRIGRERNHELQIVDGLKPGDRLIADQNIEIAEGVRVTPRPRRAAPGA